MLPVCKMLVKHGFTLYATRGTAAHLLEHDVPVVPVGWPDEPTPENLSLYEKTASNSSLLLNALDLIRGRVVDYVVNIPKNLSSTELSNDYDIRRSAIDYNVPLLTNTRLADAFLQAVCRLEMGEKMEIKSWDEY